MGIRILLPEQVVESRQEKQPVNGQDYLSSRKTHYRMKEETSHHHQRLLDRTLQAFSGLYSRHRTETAAKNGSVILSLYFLAPGNKVSLFREAFRRITEDGEAKALISGPWPPYNFVTTDLAPAGQSGLKSDDEGREQMMEAKTLEAAGHEFPGRFEQLYTMLSGRHTLIRPPD